MLCQRNNTACPFPFSRLFALVCCVTCVAILAGCGREGPDRVIVSGTVSYQGQPVEKGRIRFCPEKGTMMPTSGALIVDGKYSVEAKGGVPVGAHNVEIVGFRADPDYRPPAHTGPLPTGVTEEELSQVQYIPEKYNKRTKLEITIRPDSGRITRDYDLSD